MKGFNIICIPSQRRKVKRCTNFFLEKKSHLPKLKTNFINQYRSNNVNKKDKVKMKKS
jgi:hypothetical protein